MKYLVLGILHTKNFTSVSQVKCKKLLQEPFKQFFQKNYLGYPSKFKIESRQYFTSMVQVIFFTIGNQKSPSHIKMLWMYDFFPDIGFFNCVICGDLSF
jgi:hypothetical protein